MYYYFADIPSDVAKRGITLELCAGIVDKEGKSLAEIATEEGMTLIMYLDTLYYSARINVVWGCHFRKIRCSSDLLRSKKNYHQFPL